METTKLSSKGQVIIPKALRNARRWQPGLELVIIDSGDGLTLRPKTPFAPAVLSEVAGMFRGKSPVKSDAEIQAALVQDARSKWRGRG